MYSANSSLKDLSGNTDFIGRHIGPDEKQQKNMLDNLGYSSVEDFLSDCIPKPIFARTPFNLPEPVTEMQALSELLAMAKQNKNMHYMIGCGYNSTFIPPVLLRNFLENPGWYTAYTPYQAEISQGRLELLMNFQQMITELTNLEISNASLLDESTAAAEAVVLAYRAKSRTLGSKLLLDRDCHPQTKAVITTRVVPTGIEIQEFDAAQGIPETDDFFALLVHYPGTSGNICDFKPLFASAKERGICSIAATDPMALMLLEPPGDQGADIAIGTSQRFGVPLGFGGPHAGFIACKENYKRHLPGRIIGLSKDANEHPALRMALQTREQHIRREKATSNICTAQALLANLSALYAQYHGPSGLKRIALRIHRIARIIASGCQKSELNLKYGTYFDTIFIESKEKTDALYQKALDAGFCLRKNNDSLQISCNETTSTNDALNLLKALTGKDYDINTLDTALEQVIPSSLQRKEPALRHPIFTSVHTETEMMRYLKSLEHKDIALNRSMIPLGSCTMKLNASAEMIPITWPEFADIHPLAPTNMHKGYTSLINSIEKQLCDITGFERMSMQPNSGAQGEYAGLTAIRSYHQSRGDHHRNTCLIPSSSHGTNPASAQMAGLNVVVVRCDKHGNVDVSDLRSKAESYKNSLAALMITYPSTHGVFEEKIREVCQVIHENGGLVYMDGANTNAMAGHVKPAELGADVMHLNLHKTFCIPHGGGGPGVGPIGVNDKLTDYLPGHPNIKGSHETTIAAAPWGSALILPISWSYIRMMGLQGLKKATTMALLNANYTAKRLQKHYPILYTAKSGLVAHECIIDLRAFKQTAKISEEDIAKRLIDFGFHAPTVSFPVPGTMMIEPTESESQAEIDRFCDAMIKIRQEIADVESGKVPANDNPLVNAPHTAEDISAESWSHPYSREQACYPLSWVKEWKFWPPVKRIDNVYGDKNFCACLPTSQY